MKHLIYYIFLSLTMAFTACSDSGDDTDTNNGNGNGNENSDDKIEYKSVQQRSFKRGVSYSFQMLEDVALLGPGVSWFYNWGPDISSQLNTETKSQKLDFYPMAWNGAFSPEKIRAYKQAHPECEYILAFNEPNLTDQAHMTPQQAADQWPRLKALATELNMKIISPAMNYGTLANYSDPIKWLDEFFQLVPLSDIDGIAIHCYMGTPASLKSYVGLFKKYGKPIWMTEFCAWESYISNVSKQMSYMCDVLNYMECDPDVYRYAWFIPRTNGSVDSYPYMQLLTKTKPYELSDLGKVFVNFSSFDKSTYYTKDQVIPSAHYSALNMSESATGSNWVNSVRIRPTTDETGVVEVCDFYSDQWVEYLINVSGSAKYNLDIRYASYRGATIEVLIDGKANKTIELPSTGEDNKWTTLTTEIQLEQGKHAIRIKMNKGSACFNWLRYK